MNKIRGKSASNLLDSLENRLCLSTSNDIGTPVAIADFTGDGNLDLLVKQTTYYSLDSDSSTSSQESAVITLSILPGNGDGTFGEAIETDLSANKFSATDFNGDGKADLLILNRTGLYASLGNGDGTFTTAVKIKKVPGGTIYLADFNGDKYADILVQGGSSVKLLTGKGDGTFNAATTVTVESGFKVAKAADFTGDGSADLLLSNSTDGTISIMASNGDGTFADATDPVELSGEILSVSDFNGDGIADLLVKDVTTYTLDDTYSIDSTTFVRCECMGGFFGGGWYYGGGWYGVGFGGGFDNTETVITYDVLLGNGDGTFQDPVDTGLTQAPSFVGDFNGDKFADMIFAGDYLTTPTIQLGIGDGTFADATEITISTSDSSDSSSSSTDDSSDDSDTLSGTSDTTSKKTTKKSSKKSSSKTTHKKNKSGKKVASHKKAVA
jgi:hypothetical protein